MTTITDPNGAVVSNTASDSNARVPQSDSSPGTASVRTPVGSGDVDSSSAPPKADAAVRASSGETFQGLATLLNKQQQEFVTKGIQEFPDVYEITFTPETLKNATLAKSGVTAYNNTAMESNDTVKGKNPDTNSTNMKSRNWPVASGTQIIQVINDVFKNSSFIAEQMLKMTDEETQQVKANDNQTKQNVTWFTINTIAVPTSNFDKKRNDFSHKVTYNVSAYDINAMVSAYFPGAKYRGAHKAYHYWFTGENTAVIDYAINYDNTYQIYNVVGITPEGKSGLRANQETRTKEIYGDQFFQPRIVPQSTSGSNAQGAKGKANEGPASAEDYLFDPNALQNIKLTIVGDPAYLSQGFGIVTSKPPVEQAFLPDGTINFGKQEVVFTMAWNSPADYNLATGLMDIAQSGKNPDGTFKNLPQYAQAYKATEIVSTFNKGSFTQEMTGILAGSLKQLQSPNGTATNGREEAQTQDGARDSNNSLWQNVKGYFSEKTEPPQSATNGDDSSAEAKNVTQAELPKPPTSDGAEVSSAPITRSPNDVSDPNTNNPQLMNREY